MDTEQVEGQHIAALKRTANKHCVTLAWPTVVLAGLTALGYFAVPLLAIGGSLSVVSASLLMAVVTYAAYTPLHEAVHGAVCGGRARFRWINEMVGYLAAIVTGIPMTAHRHEHFAHHGETNRTGADPDLLCAGMTDNLRALVVKPLSMIANQYQFFVRERWARVSRRDRVVFLVETAAILGSRLILLTLMLSGFGVGLALPIWELTLTTVAVLVIGPAVGVIVLVYLFAYIVHRPHQIVGRFVDTSVFEAPVLLRSVLTWLWGFQNYHGVHHAFPRVPWYRYRALFEEQKAAILALGVPVYHLHNGHWVSINHKGDANARYYIH